MKFGEKLRVLRNDKDLTQPELAEAMGIEQSYLSKLENDKSLPSNDVLNRILDVFDIEVGDLVNDLESVGATVHHDGESNILSINGLYTASMLLCRCGQTPAGSLRWTATDRSTADIVIVVRMDPQNEQPSDYYFLPRMGVHLGRLRLRQFNGARIDTYRFDTLSFFTKMATLLRVGGAA